MINPFSGILGHRLTNDQGHIAIRVIISTVTLLLIAAAIYFLLHFQQKTHQRDIRKAQEISEFGLFSALQKLQENPHHTAMIPATSYNDGTYSAVFALENLRDTAVLTITATGSYGAVTQTKKCVLVNYYANGDTAWINRSMQ